MRLKCHVFHVYLSRKYLRVDAHIIDWNLIQVEPKGYFLAKPLHILDCKEILLWIRVVTQVKVQWKHFTLEEPTW